MKHFYWNMLFYYRLLTNPWRTALREYFDYLYLRRINIQCFERLVHRKNNPYGAPAMFGRNPEFIRHLKQNIREMLGIHCVIHGQHLVATNLNDKLHESHQLFINAANRIQSNTFNKWLFELLCDENYHRLLTLSHWSPLAAQWLMSDNIFCTFSDCSKVLGYKKYNFKRALI